MIKSLFLKSDLPVSFNLDKETGEIQYPVFDPESIDGKEKITLAQRAFLRSFLVGFKARYDIEINGLADVIGLDQAFVLPTHGSRHETVVIPAIFESIEKKLRPVAVASEFERKSQKRVFKTGEVIPIYNALTGMTPWTEHRLEQTFDDLSRLLTNGEMVMLFPEGKVSPHTNSEETIFDVGGNSAAYEIWKRNTEVPIVLCRVTGTNSSSTSESVENTLTTKEAVDTYKRGYVKQKLTGKSPPKRPASIDFKVVNKEDLPEDCSKKEFNEVLNAFYRGKPNPIIRTSYSADDPNDYPEAQEVVIVTDEKNRLNTLSDNIKTETYKFLSKLTGIKTSDLEPFESPEGLRTHTFVELGIDSVEMMKITMELEKKLDVDITDGSIQTVTDIMEVFAGTKEGLEPTELPEVSEKFFETNRKKPKMLKRYGSITMGDLKQMQRMNRVGKQSPIAFGDDALRGITPDGKIDPEGKDCLTYREKFIGQFLLAEKIQQMNPGPRIGVAMPPTGGDELLTSAALLAGKTVVMLNFTSDSDDLEAARKNSGCDIVLSSEKFLMQYPADTMNAAFKKHLYPMEELRKQFTAGDKLRALSWSHQSPKRIMKHLGCEQKADDEAMVLFTSGSTSAPKEIVLTHQNVEAGIEAAWDRVKEFMHSGTVLQVYLPGFHIFGIVLRRLAAKAGVKIVFLANPKDAKGMALNFKRFGITMTAGTPDTTSRMLDAGELEDFTTGEVFLAGAAKVSKTLVNNIGQMGKIMLEGYGLSETMILTTGNKTMDPECGVGKPLKGVTIKIMDPDNPSQELPTGKEGKIIAHTKSMFAGYPEGIASPFVKHEGKQYFNTGDIGFYDENGNLHITGRDSRFAKIGGEKVPLDSIEEILKEKYDSTEDGAQFAVEFLNDPDDGDNDVIIMFSSNPKLDVQAANELLTGKNKIKAVHLLEEIPMLATGKVDLKNLKKNLSEDDITALFKQVN